ncbi:putative membrane lipoprotein [Tasmannia lanceolata]|uniref:putative membrane lipoprotein n=1 Tax=Tasmannia lanceolata TaxID=3420 RepID=UPI00406353EE
MASSKLRSSSSFPNLLMSTLNLFLFLLSSASFVPIFLLKNPPTSLGWAFFTTSTLSLLSSFVGFYSQLTHFCFITHISLLLASSIGQALGFLMLFWREDSSLRSLDSARSPRDARIMVKMECGLLLSMFLLQLVVLVLSCALQSCWVKEYEGLEAEREETMRKRKKRMARVQEESMANVAKIEEERAKELDEKMKSKYGQWVKTDFEG